MSTCVIEEEVNGSALLELTYENLIAKDGPFKLKGGPAKNIVKAIKQFLSSTAQSGSSDPSSTPNAGVEKKRVSDSEESDLEGSVHKRAKIQLVTAGVLMERISVMSKYDATKLSAYQWVDCEETTTKQICDVWEKNRSAWPSTRSNDYAVMTIGSGSGIGKTTLGRELKNILQRNFGESLGLDTKLKKSARVATVHVFLQPESMAFPDYPRGYSPKKKPSRNPKHVAEAMEILSHTIACSYFFKATFLRINDYDMELDGAARDIGTVISAMRMREGLTEDDALVLLVQIDEFQKKSYLVLNMMRAVGELISDGFYDRYKLLLVPVPTGTALLELETIDAVIGASSLHSALISVERLSNENRLKLTYKHAKVDEDGGHLQHNKLAQQLISVCGGVSLWHVQVGECLAVEPINSREQAERMWCKLVSMASLQYSKSIWLASFSSEHVKKVLSISILQQKVSYDTRINGDTIGWHLSSGVLFPTKEGVDGRFLLEFPLVLLHSVAPMFGLPSVRYLDPFMRVDEDGFEKYIAHVIVTFCEAFTAEGPAKVTVGEFFAGGLGTANTLASEINIAQGMQYRQSAKSLHTQGNEVQLIAEGQPDGVETVDLRENTTKVIHCAKHDHTGDILAPFARIQVKSSLYVTQGQVPPDRLYVQVKAKGDKNICSVEKERKKWGGDGLFVLISNKPFQDDIKNIPEGVVVICAKQLKAFLRTFATANVFLE